MDRSRLHDLLESHLENRLSDADRTDLGAELASSREACRAFWESAHQHALIGELLAESRGYEMALREKAAALRPKSHRLSRMAAAAAAIAAVVVAAVWGLSGPGRLAAPAPSLSRDPAIARLEETEGEVYVVSEAGRVPAEAGQDLFAGHEIQSGEGSFAVVRYPDETRLELGADSTLRLMPAADAPGKKVLLTQGVVTADVVRQPEGRPLVLATPFAEVRGTPAAAARFVTAITPDATRVELEDGQVQLAPMNAGPPLPLAAGTYAVASLAGGPLSPRPLPMRLSEQKATIKVGKSVQAAAFSADGGLFAAAVGDGFVKVWDAGSRQMRTSLPLPVLAASVLAFSPDGQMLAAACPDKPAKQVRVLAWDVATGLQRAGFTSLPDVSALAFSPDGRFLAVGGAGGKRTADVLLWDLAANAQASSPPLATPPGNKGRGASSLAYSSDGSRLAVGGRDGLVQLIDLAGGRPTVLLHGHTEAVACLAFTPDGTTLASGGKGKDRTVRLWDVDGGQEEFELPCPSGAVFSVCFSPDGQTVAAGCDGGVGRLWDAATGMEKATVQGHKRPICGVAFTPDGGTLETAGREGVVKFWMIAEAEDIN
ncbi:MAG TPA: FecR domain-containing protein [Gemmataceae bacterium]|nr:FecR domain-containing protein [Gemmataceae bacterium]